MRNLYIFPEIKYHITKAIKFNNFWQYHLQVYNLWRSMDPATSACPDTLRSTILINSSRHHQGSYLMLLLANRNFRFTLLTHITGEEYKWLTGVDSIHQAKTRLVGGWIKLFDSQTYGIHFNKRFLFSTGVRYIERLSDMELESSSSSPSKSSTLSNSTISFFSLSIIGSTWVQIFEMASHPSSVSRISNCLCNLSFTSFKVVALV